MLAAIVFTVKYYYALAPIEIEMALGGSILIVIAYVLVQYLQQPKYGFTSTAPADQQMTDKLNIEALIIAETYGGVQEGNNATNFGGGGFGGGGASGDF